DRLYSGGNVNANFKFINNWAVGGGTNFNAVEFDDRVTRGGPGVYSEGHHTFWSWFDTDNRKRLSLNFFTGGGSDSIRSWFRDHEISATYRPIAALTVTSGVRINRAVNDSQWTGLVTDTSDHYVFGRIDQTT